MVFAHAGTKVTVTCVSIPGMKELMNLKLNGRISPEDMRKIYINMILTQHAFPTKPSTDGYYHTWVTTEKGGRKQLKAKTIDDLKEKVYRLQTDTLSFKTVFENL